MTNATFTVQSYPLFVMPALVAGIHVFLVASQKRGWPGQAWTSPAMTRVMLPGLVSFGSSSYIGDAQGRGHHGQ